MVGIGTDIIEIDRVKKATEKKGFLKKYFTENERALIREKGPQTAAANFAAKEAVAKAFGTGFRGMSPINIEVLRNESGMPYINLNGHAAELAKSISVKNIRISLSHCREYAVAFVMIEGGKDEGCNCTGNDHS